MKKNHILDFKFDYFAISQYSKCINVQKQAGR